MKETTSASDDKEKCDSGKDGDVVDENGNTNGNRGRWSALGVWRSKGRKVVTVADIYFHDVFPLHGIPKKIISDQGPQFASWIMCSILKRLGVDAGLTTAYHPQANGQTKRKNQEIEQYLHMFIDTH